MSEKIAVVTGCSKGIGLATAKHLCSLGYKVFALSRNKELMDKETNFLFGGRLADYKYYAVYKPFDVLCQFTPETPEDNTLADIFQFPQGVYPVGRLDKDSEGADLESISYSSFSDIELSES